MAAERIPLSGYIQYPKNLAVDRIAYHRRRTGPWLDSRAEVLRAVTLHRSTDGERGADGVRAAGTLVPVRSAFEADVPGRFHGCRVAHRLEDHPGGIGEDHYGPGLRQEVSGLFRDRHTRPDQVAMRVLKCPESLFRQRHRSLRARRINSRGGTALPGPFDHVPYGMRRQFTAPQELLPSCHHPSFLIRMWKSREPSLPCHVASSNPPTRIASWEGTPAFLERPRGSPQAPNVVLGEGATRNVSRLEGACQADEHQMWSSVPPPSAPRKTALAQLLRPCPPRLKIR